MLPHDCTPHPWLVRIIFGDGEPIFAVYEHTHAVIAVDREFWPDQYNPPRDKDGYYQLDKYAGVMSNRAGVAHMILMAPAMYELLKETLEWMDEKFPSDKYPLDTDHPYRNMHDIVIARRRENIRSVLAKAQGQQIEPEECYV